MRRALYLLAIAMVGAATAAAAQSRAVTMARLVTQTNPPTFAVHVSNLLDDPEWQERWGNAFFIQLHWKVQLWQSKFVSDAPQPPLEWDVCVQQVPGLDLFNHTTRTAGGRTTKTFRTVDSLRAYLTEDVVPRAQRQLAPGKWYYLIDVHVSTSEEDPCDPRTAPARPGFLERLVQGDGPTRDLPRRRLDFKVP